MKDRLEEIMDWKRKEIEPVVRPVSDQEWERLAARPYANPFLLSNVLKTHEERLSVIAEIKRRSPSAGPIAEGIKAEDQAIRYINGEAECLSILTDEKFFGGNIRDLWDVVELLEQHNRKIPCLRKDFMIHPIQIVEAVEAGASVILIIVRALNDDEIRVLQECATKVGLDCLFEVHTEGELERALKFDPKIVGVNNRDLTRFVTDLAMSEKLIPKIPDTIFKVSESGIFNLEDAERARNTGADAVLIGQALMEAEDPEEFIEEIHRL
ncbi:MAG: indole-3-glycerol phosphate synthase TrpC [Opitutales bacterium]|nr:indole-3-glycerol phosphate synthase TrpC [Opitutales bacterium]